MNHSNAIDNILNELIAVWDETSEILPGTLQGKTVGVGFTIIGKSRAKQALYEAVKGVFPKDTVRDIKGMAVPEFYEYADKPQFSEYDIALACDHAVRGVLANIAELFGVTDMLVTNPDTKSRISKANKKGVDTE